MRQLQGVADEGGQLPGMQMSGAAADERWA
jgi:hypothetical protein